MSLSESVKSLRVSAKLTQQELSVRSGVLPGLISRIERGAHADPAWSTVSRLMLALGCDLSEAIHRCQKERQGIEKMKLKKTPR